MRAYDFLLEVDLRTSLKPGDIERLETNLEQYEEEKRKLEQYRYVLHQTVRNKQDMPYELINKVDELIAEYEKVIEKMENQLELYKKQSSLYKLFKRIEDECSDAVAAYKNTQRVLYRGSRKSDNAFIGRPWTDRSPTHSDRSFSELYDQALSSAGAEALRSNSLFTTSDLALATGFGTHVHYIFPINGFHYTWSTVEKDIVFNSDSWRRAMDESVIEDYMDLLKPYWTDETTQKYIEIFINTYIGRGWFDPATPEEYITKEKLFDPANIGKVYGFFPKNYEISQLQTFSRLVYNKALNITDSQDYEVFSEFASMKDFVGPGSMGNILENYGVKIDVDFNKALESGHEIMINGTYFAIHRRFANEVANWLGIESLKRSY